MALPNLGPNYDLPKRLQLLEQQVQALSTRDVLQNAAIGIGGLTVTGGSIDITGGGSLTVSGTATFSGTLTVPSGTITTGGSISAGGSVTAGTSVSAGTSVTATTSLNGATLAVSGASVVHALTADAINAASLTASGNVSSSGTVTSANAFVSPGSRATTVTSSYVGAWIDGSGVIGMQPSTMKVKKDLSPLTETAGILSIQPHWGRYIWDDETTPLKVFFLAEEVSQAGFGPDVVPVDDAGDPASVNYQMLIVPLLAAVKAQQTQIDALQARLTAAHL